MMRICPFCNRLLVTRNAERWRCACGEEIPFGLEKTTGIRCGQCGGGDCPLIEFEEDRFCWN